MSSATLATIQSHLNLYGYSLFLIFGNIGNVLIVILFSRQRQNPCLMYLISAAIMNGLFLTLFSLAQLFPFYYGDGTIGELAFCKGFGYILNTLGQIARTMIVSACVDRFLITNQRATFRAFSTVKRVKWIIFIAIIFWALFDIYMPIMHTIVNGKCVFPGVSSTVYTFYAIIFVGSIPAITLGIFGYLTYRNIRKMHSRVQPIARSTTDGDFSLRRQDRDLLIIVISEVLVYVIAIIPFPLILLEMTISPYVVSNKSVQYSQIEGFILNLAYLLLVFNSTVPFYVYLISSKSFRRDFKQLIINTYRKLRGQPTISTVSGTHSTVAQRETRV